MPELPEVETIKKSLAPIPSRQILSLEFSEKNLRFKPSSDQITEINATNPTINSLSRRGKYITVGLKNTMMVFHLGMSGTILLFPTTVSRETHKHQHLTMQLSDNLTCVFIDPRRFGGIGIYRETPAFLTKLGPEPWDKGLKEHFQRKISTKNQPIKQAILDQTIISGIGNIYASEILFMAGISPLRPCKEIQKDEIDNIITATKKTLYAAIAKGGSTLKDFRDSNNQTGYFQHHWQAYNHAGEICPQCQGDNKISKIIQGQRSSFYCANHQK